MEGRRSRLKVANKLIKFGKKKISYDNLYYDVLYDFASGKLNLKDSRLFKITEDHLVKKKYPEEGLWFKIYSNISTKIKINDLDIPILGYKYILLKAKKKYIQLYKESQKINKEPRDLVRVFVNSMKQKKMNISLQNNLNLGKVSGSPDVNSRRGCLFQFNSIVLSKNIANKMMEKNDEEKLNENDDIEKKRSLAMKNHADIYIKLKEFSETKHPSNKKRVIFKGKYCQTFLFEDDEIYLKNKIMYSSKSPEKQNKKSSRNRSSTSLLLSTNRKLSNNLSLPFLLNENNENNEKDEKNISPFKKNSLCNVSQTTITTRLSKHFPLNLNQSLIKNFSNYDYNIKSSTFLNKFLKCKSSSRKVSFDNKNVGNDPSDLHSFEKKYGINKVRLTKKEHLKLRDKSSNPIVYFDDKDFYYNKIK